MIPPVSLPLNRGTQSARAGVNASIPQTATRLAAPIIRIADSISAGRHSRAHPPPWKERLTGGVDLSARCCRAALDLLRASRHRRQAASPGGKAHARPLDLLEKTRPLRGARRAVRPRRLWPAGPGRLSLGAQFLAVRPAI